MGWQDAPLVGGDTPTELPKAFAGGGKWNEAPEIGAAPASPGDSEDWHRDTLMPLEHNRKTGEWRWAVPGALQSMFEGATLPGDVLSGKTPFDPRVSMKDQDPATLDRAAALAGTVAGEVPMAARNMVPAGARELVDAAGKPLPKLVRSELASANLGPEQIRAALEAGGPAMVMGDLTPRLQARTGAIATTPGRGQDLVVDALRSRREGANQRIQGSVQDNLGPEPIPSRVATGIREGQDALQPVYEDRLARASSGDLGAVADSIDNGIMQEKGPARSALQKVRAMLDFTPPDAPGLPHQAPILDPNPTGWIKARQAIDGMMQGETDSNVIRVLGNARRQIDDALAGHVPGIKEVDSQFADLAHQQEGFTTGQQAIRPGTAPMHPTELADQMAAGAVPPEHIMGPSGVPIRIRQGLLSDIYRIVGNTANDRVALKKILLGDGSWNRDKLVTAFGQERADRLIRLFDNEAQMATTEDLAFGNSKTEVLHSAKEGIEPSKREPGFLRSAANLKVGDALMSAADKALGGVVKKAGESRNEAIARALLSRQVRTGAVGSVPAALARGASYREIVMDVARRGGGLPGVRGNGGGGF